MTLHRSVHRGISIFIALVFVLTAVDTGAAFTGAGLPDISDQPDAADPPEDGITLGFNPQTGQLIFVGTQAGQALASPGDVSALSAEQNGLLFIGMYAAQLGLTDPATQMQAFRIDPGSDGLTVVRYHQVYQGIPVFAAETVIDIDAAGALLAMSAKLVPNLSVDIVPVLDAAAAAQAARQAVAAEYGVAATLLANTPPELCIYDERLLTESLRKPILAWKMEVDGQASGLLVDEVVLVEAGTGRIALNYPLIDVAAGIGIPAGQAASATYSQAMRNTLNSASSAVPPRVLNNPLISIYDMKHKCLDNGTPDDCTVAHSHGSLPGSKICDESNIVDCSSDWDAITTFMYVQDTYDLYADLFGRDSVDNDGLRIKASIHYGVDYKNAYWNGSQIVLGEGMDVDDVIGHELTHGVTRFESGLVYAYQPGAINESLSDAFGEFVDQANGETDATKKWLVAEDAPGGPFRSMKDPPLKNQPDKMSSAKYYTGGDGDNDHGGVHTNSGVNNKAVYFMAEGGVFFTGANRAALGSDKVARIYYKAQTSLLTSGSNYYDLYFILPQACRLLVGHNGITTSDCTVVQAAVDAVEMKTMPAGHKFAPECPANMSFGASLLTEDMESGDALWEFVDGKDSSSEWEIATGNAISGTHSLWAKQKTEVNISYAQMVASAGTLIPTGGVHTYLRFNHSYKFDTFFDGGTLSYSVDSAPTTWTDAAALFSDGQNYDGRMVGTNPLSGKSGFVQDSHGYTSSRYDLTTLKGKRVRFRWTSSNDVSSAETGWYVDDVQIYTCLMTPTQPVLVSPTDTKLITGYTPLLDWKDSTNDLSYYQVQVSSGSVFSTASLVYERSSDISQYLIPANLASGTTYYWRVKAFNWKDQGSAWSTPFSFRTIYATPDLLDPVNNWYLEIARPTFIWKKVPRATGYTLEISKKADFAAANLWKAYTIATPNPTADPGPDPSLTLGTDLPEYQLMYWRVRATGACGPGAWSETFQFTSFGRPSIPKLLTPKDTLLVKTASLGFDWSDSDPLADYYQFQIAKTSDFASPTTDIDDADHWDESYFPTLPISTWLWDPATTYYWRVRAVDDRGRWRGWSATRTFYMPINPPGSLAITENADTLRPTFTWVKPLLGTPSGYTIQVSTASSFASFVINAPVTGARYVPAKDLPPKTPLFWRVITNHSTYGPSNPSAVQSFTSVNPPKVPELVSPPDNALLPAGSVDFDWKDSTAPAGTTLATYEWEISSDAAFAHILQGGGGDAGSSKTTLSLPSPSTTLYWHVRATNTAGQHSAWSNGRKLRLAIDPPAALVSPGGSASLHYNRPTFTWTAPAVGTPGGYTIQISRKPDFSTIYLSAVVSGTSFTPASDLTPWAVFYWRVITNHTTYGPSAPTHTRSFTAANPPGVPALVSPANDTLRDPGTAILDWSASTIPANTYFDHYQVQLTQYSDFLYTDDATLTAHQWTVDLSSPARTYYWRVRAYNTFGDYSVWSAVRTIRTRIDAPLIGGVWPIDGPTQTLLTNRPSFSWDHESADYTLQVSRSPTYSSFVLNVSVPSQGSLANSYSVLSDLPANTLLYWRVRANGGTYGNSDWANGSSFTTANPPGIPSLLSPANNLVIYDYTPTLRWNQVSLPAGTTFDHYELQLYREYAPGLWEWFPPEIVAASSAPEYTPATDWVPGSAYTWQVRAYNTLGQYSTSSPVWTVRLAMLPPVLLAPEDGFTTTNRKPVFDWEDVTGATGYTIQISANPAFTSGVTAYTVTASTCTPTSNLAAGTLYWRVRANGPNGPSNWSAARRLVEN